MRLDLEVISGWILPKARVLDLGCGSGDLLQYLIREKNIEGVGIEKDGAKVASCIEKGLAVLQGDINEEIRDYADDSYDYVVISQTLQQTANPQELIHEALRVGEKCIVSFPNFSHWKVRLSLFATGNAPITSALPYEWYDTPNIRVITIRDFKRFLKKESLAILGETAASVPAAGGVGRRVKCLTNLRATHGMFLFGPKKSG
ncbi:MAG: methionine biosynthesis protein MetW [Deltaproteobacteria bacterium]|nr:methionine biosynthesis protein MetW [Deltaproteobacteria bacterium]